MSTQHTPGPWKVVDGHYPSFKSVTGPSFKISVVMWATDLTEADYQKRNADLHLIAAAPDLLEFAQKFLNDYHSEDGMLSMKHYAREAHAAIAKATGAA
jgi:hypothetical protein